MPKNKGISLKNKKTDKKSIKERLTETLELPKEIILDVPRITVIGNIDIIIENYKGVFEYSDNRIRINTIQGIIKIEGLGLQIKEIVSEEVSINGKIHKIEFV